MTHTLETVHAEYTQLCTQYGDLSLQKEALERKLTNIRTRVDELAKIQQELLNKPKEVEDKPSGNE